MTTRPIQNVLLLTGDPIGTRMAGPGMRCVNLAQSLQHNGFNVKVITTNTLEDLDGIEVFHVARNDHHTFSEFHNWADAVIFQALGFDDFPELRKSSKFLIADAYAPVVLENLARFRKLTGSAGRRLLSQATRIQREQLLRSDLVLCANENQRLYYIGALAALDGFSFENYSRDENLNQRIITVPFGLSETPPHHRTKVLKSVIPGINADDKVVLWSGGIYEWFDVETLVRAFSLIKQRSPNIKLFFMGGIHPNPDIPEMPVVSRAKSLAAELGLLNKTVFFNNSWVSMEERENYLTEADLGVTTHFNSLETTFSFRTRMLDYIWAKLPVVTTEGDFFAKVIEQNSLGEVSKFANPSDLANSIVSLLADNDRYERARDALSSLQPTYYWDHIVTPLVKALRDNIPNDSRIRNNQRLVLSMKDAPASILRTQTLVSHSLEILKSEGLKGLIVKMWRKIAQ